METDRILPHSTEAEEAVIGTLVSYPGLIDEVKAILTPEMFYRPDLGKVFKACVDLSVNGGLDLTTLSIELRKRNMTDIILDLTDMSSRIMSSAMVENHALLIKQTYLLRQYVKVGAELVDVALTQDLDQVIDKVETDLLSISSQTYTKEPKRLGEVIDEVLVTVQKIISGEVKLIGVPSGFTSLDRATGGFKPGELTIIAGRPSHGKTALGLQIARNAAELGNAVGIFSCEMSESELGVRFISGVSDYTNIEIIRGDCDMKHLVDTSESLQQLPIYLDDTSAATIMDIRAKSKKLLLKHDIKMIIVDYLQLMEGVGQFKSSREQQISFISRGLKSIAKDLNIAVIALSQLNREPEGRADRKPQLSDLRESGAIEQDADICLMVMRPSCYGLTTITIAGVEESARGLMMVNIAKNRNGRQGEITLHTNESVTYIQ